MRLGRRPLTPHHTLLLILCSEPHWWELFWGYWETTHSIRVDESSLSETPHSNRVEVGARGRDPSARGCMMFIGYIDNSILYFSVFFTYSIFIWVFEREPRLTQLQQVIWEGASLKLTLFDLCFSCFTCLVSTFLNPNCATGAIYTRFKTLNLWVSRLQPNC
jgi:hypothetical protein